MLYCVKKKTHEDKFINNHMQNVKQMQKKEKEPEIKQRCPKSHKNQTISYLPKNSIMHVSLYKYTHIV